MGGIKEPDHTEFLPRTGIIINFTQRLPRGKFFNFTYKLFTLDIDKYYIYVYIYTYLNVNVIGLLKIKILKKYLACDILNLQP